MHENAIAVCISGLALLLIKIPDAVMLWNISAKSFGNFSASSLTLNKWSDAGVVGLPFYNSKLGNLFIISSTCPFIDILASPGVE